MGVAIGNNNQASQKLKLKKNWRNTDMFPKQYIGDQCANEMCLQQESVAVKCQWCCLPSFLKVHSSWWSFIFFTGPRKTHPAPAYWQATKVPSQRYLRWSSSIPRWLFSLQESEFGHITESLSRSLNRKGFLWRKIKSRLCAPPL